MDNESVDQQEGQEEPAGGVAVIGMSLRFPGADSVDEYWRNLVNGIESIATFSDEELITAGVDPALVADPSFVKARGLFSDPEMFDPAFFGISAREAELMDPQHRVFLESCWSALEDAGYVSSKFDGAIGVWGGMSTGMTNNTYLLSNLHHGGRVLDAEDVLPAMLGNENDYLTTRVSYKLNLRGPSINVQSACSTSLVAITQAYQTLMLYGCDMALAGGVSVSFPQKDGYLFQEGGIGSPDGHCRPFDARAQGTVFSNGVGVVVLKRLEDAIADRDTIFAVIRGGALNNDGAAKMSFAAPSVDGQAEVISTAQAIADVDPETITYVECHGTATPIGDPIEVSALTKAFREGTDARGFCALGSVKSNFGHLDSAAGVAAFIKTALSLYHGKIAPTLHFQTPNPQLDLENSPFFVADRLLDWQPACGIRRAGVSGFGIGGTNAHLILEEPPVQPADTLPEQPAAEPQLLILSGKSRAALEDNVRNLAAWLERPDAEPCRLADVAYTLQQGREEFRHRVSLVATDLRDAAATLSDPSHWRGAVQKAMPSGGRVALLFPGGGAQYAQMGRELLTRHPVFAETVNQGVELVRSRYGVDLNDVWFPRDGAVDNAGKAFERPSLQLPALYIIEVALARLWQHWGIEPVALLGHSMGENAAACVAGVMSFEDGLGLVRLRGELFEQVSAGGMLSVALSAEELTPYLGDNLDLATVNAPEQCTVSGAEEHLAALEQRFQADGVDYQRIPIAIAAHSRLLEPILAPFKQYLESIELQAPAIPILSNLTGSWLTDEQARSPEYWTRHLRSTVRFADCIHTLAEQADLVLLESGPGRILGSLARLNRPDLASRVVPTLRHPAEQADDHQFFLGAAGNLWAAGIQLNWQATAAAASGRRVRLPTYAFQRQRYLLEPADAPPAAAIAAAPAIAEAAPVQPAVLPVASDQPTSATTATTATQQRVNSMQSRFDLIVGKLTQILHDMSGIPLAEIDPAESFLDMGFDSLFLTQANLKFKKEFKVKITFRQLFEDAPNIQALATFIDAQLAPDALQDELAASTPAPAATPEPAPADAAAAMPALPAVTMATAPQLTGVAPGGALQQAILLQIQASTALLQAVGQAGGMPAPQAVPAAAAQAPAPAAAPAQPAPENFKPASAEQVRAARALGPYKPIDKSASSFKLSNQAKAALEDFIRDYSERTAQSKALAENQRPYLSDARSISNFRQEWKEIVYQIAAGKGSKGSRVYDLDGNEYIDLTSGFGINLFGYSPEWATRAAHQQLDEGIELGTLSPKAYEAAKLVRELTGMDRCTFTNTGSEAIAAAIRAARTTTGRDMIAVFYDEYHGISDEVLVNLVKMGDERQTVPTSPGIPQNLVDNVLVLEWDDPNCMERIRAHADDLAAVIVEPVQNRNPSLKTSIRFPELREVTREHDIALIYDEMITGFRLAQGGAQEYFGVEADMVCYGKIIAGGMPAAVVAGRGEYLDCFDGGPWHFGDDSFPEAGVTFFGGTYTRHPIAVATTLAALQQIKAFGKAGYHELNARARGFAHRLNELLTGRGYPARIENCETIFNLKFNDDNPMSRLIFWQLRHRGVLLYDRPFFIATAHSDADFDFVLEQFEASIDFLQSSGIVPVCGVDGVYDSQKLVPFNTAQAEVHLATELGEAASKAFHEQVIYDFDETLDLPALRHAIQKVVFKHDGLRAHVNEEGDGFVVLPARHLPLRLLESRDEGEAEQHYRNLLSEGFDLQKEPLTRFSLVRHLDSAGQVQRDSLVITAHHLVIDGWSMGIVLKDLADIYNAVLNSERCMPRAEHQLGDFLEEEQSFRESDEFTETADFWKSVYADTIPEPIALPLDHQRPAVQRYRGERHSYRFGKSLSAAVREFSNRQNCTAFTTLFTVFSQFIAQLTQQDDLVIAIPMAGQAMVGMPDLVGHSVNFLPLRVQHQHGERFTEALNRYKGLILEVNDNQRFAYLDLIRELNIKRNPSQPPLAPVSFNVDQGMEAFSFGDQIARYRVCPRNYVKNDMFFNIVEEADEFTLELDRNSDLVDAATVDNWVAQFKEILERVIEDPQTIVEDMDFSDELNPKTIQRQWNQTERHFAQASSDLVSVFEASVDVHADSTALVFEGESRSYRELDQAANQLANHLIARGIAAEDRVALLLERSFDMLIGIYGVLKAGAAYVPLDTQHPASRIAEIVADSGASLILTHGATTELVPAGVESLRLDARDAPHQTAAASRPNLAIPSERLAYVIYTSGTTGKPKGVMNEHGAVLNRLLWGQELFQMAPGDKHLLKTPYTFDVSVPELFWPLQVGATLVIARPDGHRDSAYLVELLERERINFVHFVPSMLHEFLQHEAGFNFPALRQVHCTGEELRSSLRDLCFEKLPSVRLFNLYGPTEAAVEVSAFECRPGDTDEPVPLGSAAPNNQLFVLDARLKPVAPGAVGELFIGGIQVARGYLNRPELTAERFIDNPLGMGGARLYRTGDLARFRRDGQLEYLGREDGQVKLRGNRVELGEIETAMNALPFVHASAAAVQSISDSDQRLIGFIKFVDGADEGGQNLRRLLGETLPIYMIPQFFVPIDEIPLTSSGKLDRKALLQMPILQLGGRESRQPESASEKLLARLWADSIRINLDEIQADDNFFDIGGHSLLAMDTLRKVERIFGKRLSLQDILYNGLSDIASMLPALDTDDLDAAYARADSGRDDKPKGGVVRKFLGMFSQDGA